MQERVADSGHLRIPREIPRWIEPWHRLHVFSVAVLKEVHQRIDAVRPQTINLLEVKACIKERVRIQIVVEYAIQIVLKGVVSPSSHIRPLLPIKSDVKQRVGRATLSGATLHKVRKWVGGAYLGVCCDVIPRGKQRMRITAPLGAVDEVVNQRIPPRLDQVWALPQVEQRVKQRVRGGQ